MPLAAHIVFRRSPAARTLAKLVRLHSTLSGGGADTPAASSASLPAAMSAFFDCLFSSTTWAPFSTSVCASW